MHQKRPLDTVVRPGGPVERELHRQMPLAGDGLKQHQPAVGRGTVGQRLTVARRQQHIPRLPHQRPLATSERLAGRGIDLGNAPEPVKHDQRIVHGVHHPAHEAGQAVLLAIAFFQRARLHRQGLDHFVHAARHVDHLRLERVVGVAQGIDFIFEHRTLGGHRFGGIAGRRNEQVKATTHAHHLESQRAAPDAAGHFALALAIGVEMAGEGAPAVVRAGDQLGAKHILHRLDVDCVQHLRPRQRGLPAPPPGSAGDRAHAVDRDKNVVGVVKHPAPPRAPGGRPAAPRPPPEGSGRA